jgi:hypothetical protein
MPVTPTRGGRMNPWIWKPKKEVPTHFMDLKPTHVQDIIKFLRTWVGREAALRCALWTRDYNSEPTHKRSYTLQEVNETLNQLRLI